MKINPALTKPHDARMQQLIRNTPEGMAHWAGTGPLGFTCKDCTHYTDKKKCSKFKAMMGKWGKAFSAKAPCCRFFEKPQ